MSLFQKSVEKKYLNELDSALIDKKFAEFQEYFGNAERQENIRNAKEEQFQEGFLRELFVKIFDYTLNPELNYNLTTELKNVSDSKKADGAILRNENAIAVIELKSTDTTDLGKVESQAFGYKNHHPKCVYVITSNFEKLRFYIQNAVNYFEFDLFKLTKEEFSLLWLCLAKDNLLNDLPLKIKESSLAKEENITKQLYADYSKFREALYQNLVKNNPEVDKLTLFKKTQKLIDRFLFIFFAEDKQLLPANSILQIIEKWKDDVDFGDVKSLYSLFRKYFHILNVGRPKSEKRQEIFAYNGGLFLTDEVLENVKIDDDVLKEHTLKLSNYDFDTDVDVNILGHIFEHSLGEIENVQAEIKGERVEQEKTKRKKDGIFYTPKYITKYIVENTIGKLCDEKRKELEIVDEEYAKGRRNRRKETIKELDAKLTSYREWLKSLTIIDPACGSGAFLNQALEFLIEEHRKIDELKAQLLGGGLIFSDITTEILEKNIYGVDINEESVEIAKLSLWLRTAQKGRKLNTLSNNIKCGNSLIDDPEVAGDKAFNWHSEFPEIFSKGGFDVIIGNPPYVESNHITKSEKKFYYDNYRTAENRMNLYGLFLERSINILKKNYFYGLIIPNYWLSTDNDFLLRKKVFVENYALSIFNTYQVFTDATVDTVLLIGQKCTPTKKTTLLSIKRDYKTVDERLQAIGNHVVSFEKICNFDPTSDLKTSFSKKINVKIEQNLSDLFIVSLGIVPYRKDMGTPIQTKEMCENKVYHSIEKLDNSYLPLLGARQVQRYNLRQNEYFIKYGPNLAEPRTINLFTGNRLLVNRILSKRFVDVTYCDFSAVNNSDGFNLVPITKNIPIKAILAIVASRFCAFYFRSTNINLDRATFPKLNVKTLASFPLPKFESIATDDLATFADIMLSHNKELQETSQIFQRTIQRKFNLEVLPTKLQEWYLLTYKEFINELAKKNIKLILSEEAEWEKYFIAESKKALEIKHQIDTTDKKIDKMVYELYNLTEEEIKIIEEE
jgi:type I restriction-modification system DNA methylase subunit